ncbi:hypothetical protein [Mycobacterium colombiense]|uniref:hypothetical protein n=1 Tax=Mycobacterium colombiense TaxID=339268 RepID=UPI001319F71E|nr:hypothetical protein [Mycobacterium colombiense]
MTGADGAGTDLVVPPAPNAEHVVGSANNVVIAAQALRAGPTTVLEARADAMMEARPNVPARDTTVIGA